MSLLLLANTVYANTAQLVVTDTSDVATTDQSGIYTVTGASRQIAWTSNATSDRRISYVNKAGNLSATHAVLTRADKHNGHTIQIHSFETYASSSTLQYNSGSSFSETLIGPLGQDYVRSLGSLSSKQGFSISFLAGTGGNYTKVLHSVYFCSAFTFSYPSLVQIQPLPRNSRYTVKHESFLVDQSIMLYAERLTMAEATQLEQLYKIKENPLFLYDADETLIRDGLAHCIVSEYRIRRLVDDFCTVEMNLLRLKSWS